MVLCTVRAYLIELAGCSAASLIHNAFRELPSIVHDTITFPPTKCCVALQAVKRGRDWIEGSLDFGDRISGESG